MYLLRFFAPLVLLALSGCHSAFIDATVSNHSSRSILLIEVDYPSASFGTQNLAPGADFHYRFKVLGSGPVKVIYTDATRREQTASGPTLNEGDEGPLSLIFTPVGPEWHTLLTKR